MSPFAVIIRLALACLMYGLGLVLLCYHWLVHRDLALGIACAMACAFCAWTVGPPEEAIHDLIDQLRKIEN